MPKRLKNGALPRDANQLAHHVVRLSTESDDESPSKSQAEITPPKGLSAYMSALGRKGGQISGAKRMDMPVEERRRIASLAARAMWKKRKAAKKR